jgi:hypothetical protein
MGYPKQPTEAQRAAALDGLVRAIRRDLAAACYVRDRAFQYDPSSGSHDALLVVAAKLERGEHLDALMAGELDDLVNEAMKRRSDRLRREAEAHAAEIRAGGERVRGMNRYTLTVIADFAEPLTEGQIAFTRALLGEHESADGMPAAKVVDVSLVLSSPMPCATGLVPPIGSTVMVEATVVAHNMFPTADEGPPLPVPCVKVRDGVSFGVACHDLQRATPAKGPAK